MKNNNITQEGVEPSPGPKSNNRFKTGSKKILKIATGAFVLVLATVSLASISSVEAGRHRGSQKCDATAESSSRRCGNRQGSNSSRVSDSGNTELINSETVLENNTRRRGGRTGTNTATTNTQSGSIVVNGEAVTSVTATSVPVAQNASGEGCDLVYNYSNWDQAVAYAVCMGESGGNANAYNSEAHNGCNGSLGLFQIACVHGAGSTFDPQANVAYANQLYSQQGWQPWGAYTDGRYRAYL